MRNWTERKSIRTNEPDLEQLLQIVYMLVNTHRGRAQGFPSSAEMMQSTDILCDAPLTGGDASGRQVASMRALKDQIFPPVFLIPSLPIPIPFCAGPVKSTGPQIHPISYPIRKSAVSFLRVTAASPPGSRTRKINSNMATQNQKNLVEKNKEYAAGFTQGDLALPPAKKYAVGQSLPPFLRDPGPSSREPHRERRLTRSFLHWGVPVTCMDARIDTHAAFGISLGDAHVIRNAGGTALDALRSLVISQQLLGTREIILVKHTGCGMLIFDTPAATGLVEKNLGPGAKAELAKFVGGQGEFQTFGDLEQAVRDDVQFLRESQLIGDDVVVSGWVYEVETGKTRQVV